MEVYWRDDDAQMSSLWSQVDKGETTEPGGPNSSTSITGSATRPSVITSPAPRTSQPSSGATTLSTVSDANAAPRSAQNTTEISRNLKLGLGVGVPLACIAIFVTGFTCFLVQKKRRRLRSTSRKDANQTAELDGHSKLPEMETTRWEMLDKDRGAELENNWKRELGDHAGSELPA